MKKLSIVIVAAIVSGSVISSSLLPVAASSTLTIGGSTTIHPITTALEAGFEANNSDIDVNIVEPLGSSKGFSGVVNGLLNVGNMSRDLKASEKSEYPYIVPVSIGYDAVAVIVHVDNPVSNLTKEQVINIFGSVSAPTTNWSSVGGNSAEIALNIRDTNSGTREAFKEMALDGNEYRAGSTEWDHNQAVVDAVKNDVNAIGYCSLAYALMPENAPYVKAISIESVACTIENAKSQDYPYVRPLNIVTRREPVSDTEKWLMYCLSQTGQDVVEQNDYIPVNDDELNVSVDSSLNNMVETAQEVASKLTYTDSLPISVASKSDADAIADVINEAAEGAIIARELTSSEVAAKLEKKAIGKLASGQKIYYVTKLAARGGSQLYMMYFRNPLGQAIVEKHGNLRAWTFGDLSGDGVCNSADYSMLKSYLLGKAKSFPSEFWLYSADPTGDSNINTADYSAIRSKILLRITEFKAATNYVPYYPPMP